MLKKLRLKFIIVNMGIVVSMLALIFGLLYAATARSMERDSLEQMAMAALNPRRTVHQFGSQEAFRVPHLSVLLNAQGECIEISGGYIDPPDAEFLEALLVYALASEEPSGVISEYNLRFLRAEITMGTRIVFVDTSSEQATLRSLLHSFLALGSAAFAAFLGISILLAYWAVKPVENAWKQQKQFVADASHELKTPLTVIMTDAELLRAPECSEEDRQQLVGSVLSVSGQMRGLVESLLELARIDSGDVGKVKNLCDFGEIVLEEAMLFDPVFFEKELVFQYDAEEHITVHGNPAHLRELTDILLDNAAKYASPNAQVRLTLRRTGARKCLLTVENQGPEIPPEELGQLFKRFYRADKARTMNHSYGLGLAIAESIVQEQHGRIWCESKNGLNRFLAELPTDGKNEKKQ